MAFAEGTSVPVEKSQMEIAGTIRKYGAQGFQYGEFGNKAKVEFSAHGRLIRFVLALPTPNDEQFARKKVNAKSWAAATPQQRQAAAEAEVRRRWRALALVIKAKLEVVESGIAEFEHEFLPNTVMPDGRTVAEHVMPEVARAYELGRVESPLLAIEGGS